MIFLDQIFASLDASGDAVVLQELREGQPVALTARELLAQVQVARAYLRRLRLKKGDRCALLAHNSIRWVAMDLAIMAEGLIACASLCSAGSGGTGRDDEGLLAGGDRLRRAALADAIMPVAGRATARFQLDNVFTN